MPNYTQCMDPMDDECRKTHRFAIEMWNTFDYIFALQIRGFLSEASIIVRTRNCDNYFNVISTFSEESVTAEELAFPLAMGHSVHTNVGILEMFLALNFRLISSYLENVLNNFFTHCLDYFGWENQAHLGTMS